MASMFPLQSCAVAELASIRYGNPAPRKKGGPFVDLYAQKGSPENSVKQAMKGTLGTAIIFSDPEPYAYGHKLAKYIRRHGLGKVRMVEGKNHRYNDGHKVKVWLWLVDKQGMQGHERRMIATKKWSEQWRFE